MLQPIIDHHGCTAVGDEISSVRVFLDPGGIDWLVRSPPLMMRKGGSGRLEIDKVQRPRPLANGFIQGVEQDVRIKGALMLLPLKALALANINIP